MRIAMVSEHASPLAVLGGVDAGGQNVYVAALARACARAGHRVVVYTRRADPAVPRRVKFAPGVEVIHVDAGPPHPIPKDDIYPHVPDLAAGLSGEWQRDPPDIVHAHFWMSGLASLLAANPSDLPVAMTFHALGKTKRDWQGVRDTSPRIRFAEEEYLARSCDQLIATAKHEMFELRAMGASRRRISRVPCGVDLARFHPGVAADTSVPRHRRARLLVVSRLVERKGIDTVVDALADLPGAELVIAGGPPLGQLAADREAQRLCRRAEAVGVRERVRMLGRVSQDKLPALYRSADVVVCTPWYEPFGMVALEAMACGVPVVASSVGGLCDTVVDGKTGVLVRPSHASQVATAIGGLLDSPERRRTMGEHAAACAHARYGWDTIARDMTRVYRATVQRVGRGRRVAG
jgi:glycosyltransferase involved in cell wall biosynthesis